MLFHSYSVRAKKVLNRYPDMNPKYHVIEVDLRRKSYDMFITAFINQE
jgi:hypothetical protein